MAKAKKKKQNRKRSYKDVYKGKYLRSRDLPKKKGKEFVLEGAELGEVQGDEKLIGRFENDERLWVLNETNCQVLADATGTDDFNKWSNLELLLFNDLSVRGPSGERGGTRIKEVLNGREDDAEEEDDDLDELEDDDE